MWFRCHIGVAEGAEFSRITELQGRSLLPAVDSLL